MNIANIALPNHVTQVLPLLQRLTPAQKRQVVDIMNSDTLTLTEDEQGNIIDSSLKQDNAPALRSFNKYRNMTNVVIADAFAITEEELLGYE